MSESVPLLELEGICKSFGSLRANDSVDLAIQAGEVHALLGENGAGKSTLIKILCGVLAPDDGAVRWHGKRVSVASPAAARALGIGTVHQHFALFAAMTVAENIALGLPQIPRSELADRISNVAEQYGMPLQPDRPLHTLSVGEWQRVEIVRCLLAEPELIVLDEPTSVLTPQEADLLFAALGKITAQGKAVLYISHRLAEIRALCHKATVMRLGKVVARCDPTVETPASLAAMMVGRELQPPMRRSAASAASDRAGLVLDNVAVGPRGAFGTALDGISLTVAPGKVVAIAGIAGNGQAELAAVLGGETPVRSASLMLDGEPIGHLPPQQRRRRGMLFIPEERNGHAAVPDMTLWENTLLTARYARKLARGGVLDRAGARAYAGEIISEYKVAADGPQARAASLSGGNLQKFIMGRELLQQPRTLVAVQPTWGVDAGAAADVRQALLDLAAGGAAVLVISQDLDEVFEIADEVAVINLGQLSAPAPAGEMSAEQVGLQMGGIHGAPA